MKIFVTLASGMLLLAASTSWAEVYRHVDAQGNVTFSDEPIKGGETVKSEARYHHHATQTRSR